MTRYELTTGAQTLTAAAAVAPTTGLDISGIPAATDFMLEIEIMELAGTTTPSARIVLEDTVDAFTAAIPVCELNPGPVQAGASQKYTWKRDRAESLRIGVTSAKLRARLAKIDGTNATITLQAALHH